jgi:isochorismate hydrolase
MNEEERKARARQELEEKRHRDILVELWGEDYKNNPRYEEVVTDIACKARTPFNALCDRRGI